MRHTLKFAFLFALAAGLTMPAAAGTKEELIKLQTQVQALQDEMARMRQSFDERMGVMRSLVEQTTDNVNRMNAGIGALQKTLQDASGEAGSRNDRVSEQIQALHDSVDELKARFTRVSAQLDDIRARQESVPAAPAAPPQAQAPPPDVLYNNALRDYTAGRYDLAQQQFAEFLKFYETHELAGNAVFYLADVHYRQGDFESAVREYDRVLEQYPGGNKAAAAQLKKGFALLELGQRQAGVRELNSLIARHPKSPEAMQARERLRKLGTAASTQRKPSAVRR